MQYFGCHWSILASNFSLSINASTWKTFISLIKLQDTSILRGLCWNWHLFYLNGIPAYIYQIILYRIIAHYKFWKNIWSMNMPAVCILCFFIIRKALSYYIKMQRPFNSCTYNKILDSQRTLYALLANQIVMQWKLGFISSNMFLSKWLVCNPIAK